MTSEWSTLPDRPAGLDLHLELGDGARRTSIEDALRRAIRDGRLPTGARVPSTRVLSRDLAVARGTVTDAYDQLIAEGWLAARRGSGTVVAWAGERHRGGRVQARTPAVPAPYDFRPGSPDVSSFPRQEWLAATRKVLRTMPDADLRYGDPRGLLRAREALAGYLARARGVRADPDRLVICGGFVQALALLTATLRQQGAAVVAMENPCMNAYRTVTARAGLSVRFLDVDDDGADPAPLVSAFAHRSGSGRSGWDDVAAVLLTPAHQYPTGTTLAPDRRAAFVEWARLQDRIVIEDDYDGEHRYDRQPVGALQGMDAERVAYVGTASKSLAPGLRLGWMVLPDVLVAPVSTAKELADRQSGVIEQAALAELITSGGLDRHIRRNRLRYRRRRDALVAALSTVPSIRVQGIAAGLHAVVHLPVDGPAEADVVASLAAAGVVVHGLSGYWHRPRPRRPGIVVGFGTPAEHAFPAALAALTEGLQSAVAGSLP
jgi:GntR family transcriptional regulator/MocR family aminotransferase